MGAIKKTVIFLSLLLSITTVAQTPPAGNHQEIQFNNSGVFGSSPYLKWDGTNLNFLDLGAYSAKLHFKSGDSDRSYIFSENYGTNLNRLVIQTDDDGDSDYTVFRNRHWNDGYKDVFEIRRTYTMANSNFYVMNGNMGIGTTTPSETLDVNGNISISSTVYSNKGFVLDRQNYGSKWKIWSESTGLYHDWSDDNFTTKTRSLFLKNTGEVGIGTIEPSALLEIRQKEESADKALVISEPNNSQKIYLHLADNASGEYGYFHLGDNTKLRGNGLHSSFGGSLGIGIANPKEKLHIEGNMLIDTYNLGNDNGIFFREGFSAGNKYNLSILNFDHSNSGDSPDGLSINAFDGISFSTGSNTRNERMRIDKNGNVGIGTTDPDSKLTVKGHVNIGGDGNYHLKTRHIDGKDHLSTNVDRLYLNYNTGKDVYVGFGGQESSLLVNGNIKTSSVNSVVSIVGEGTGNYDGAQLRLSAKGVTPGNEHASTWFITHRGVDGIANIDLQRRNLLSQYRGSLLLYRDNLGWVFNTAPSTTSTVVSRRMIIKNTGEVGIGTDETHGFKLGVKGKIAAEEVKVALHGNWPDFIFNSDYKLPTLKNVEKHIKSKGHLKNIPSAKDVKENGIFLGEMDAKLLQKIEELTLYTIQQEKKIDLQNSKIQKLEKENQKLKALSDRITAIEKLLKK